MAVSPPWTAAAAAHTMQPLKPTALSTRLATPLQREVMGFVNAGSLGDPNVGYTSWSFGLLSSVVYFALHVNSGDGALVQTDTGWSVYHSSTMSSFVATAHSSGTKVLVSINLHDLSTDPNSQMCQGLDPTHAQVTISQSIAQMNLLGLDGININYEGTNAACANGQSTRAELDSFTQNMRAAFPAGKELVIDTYSGSAEDNLEFFDITGLQPSVDAFFVMAYDMDASNWTDPPLSCTSYCFSPVSPLNTYRFNVTKSMTQYLALVPKSKIILGQPYYGRRGCVSDLTTEHQNSIPNTNFVSPTYIYASTIPSQSRVFNFAAHRDSGDRVSEWDTWFDGDFNCNRMQYFDDVTSLGAKYDLINTDDLRGVGLFTLDYGGGSPELWNLIAAKFTTTTLWTSLGGVLTSGPASASWAANRMDAFAGGLDNQVWHTWWDGVKWNAWQPLGGSLTSDPAAVSWGANRIDIFARGLDNAVWHQWWDGTKWGVWQSLGGQLTSGVEAASWSANRLDVVARGLDNQVWHTWWDGAKWNSWQPLGGILITAPTAVSWGPNRLDVFGLGLDSGLWHTWWDGTKWNNWQPLGGPLASGPTAASCTSGHLDVFALGSDHGLWRNGWTGTQWTGWQSQGGRWTSDPSAVCQAGSTNVDVFDRGIDYALWHTSITAS